jgi:hypothetical protein
MIPFYVILDVPRIEKLRPNIKMDTETETERERESDGGEGIREKKKERELRFCFIISSLSLSEEYRVDQRKNTIYDLFHRY